MITKANRLNTVEEYYFSKKLKEVNQLISDGKPVINMGIGSPDLAPHMSVIEAIQQSFLEPTANMYQSYQGLSDLRNGFCNYYKSNFNVEIDFATEILPLMGSKEGIMHIAMAFLNEGDSVLIPNPGYPTYQSVSNLVGAKTVLYDLDEKNNWYPDFETLEKQDLTNVKLMWVCYPHMPTGAQADLELFEKLIAFGKRHHILIVNDNPYSSILNDNPLSILQVEGAKDIAIELNSLSKTYNMAGWRVGMVIGSSENIASILKVKSNMDSGMFFGIQKGAIEALKLGKDWFESLNAIYRKRRELMFLLCDKLQVQVSKNQVGMFVWAKLPKGVSSEEFINDLLYEKSIFITPGTIFGSQGEGYVRFSLCVKEEKINEALTRF
ncbi:aminotransferase class I/II-fold pyridoxal phosphate-dependent enzyme [Flavobacterium jejuense]|uniref:Aminotransferase n=1 Tax=Flavobacterium jejuense TaxID=1544455 RepID=A0ABX0J0A4_9FLAO|nr:aminotransferase class I/II-fold pyridoxal phosphate-dependent enzyme [Flavobacterium jejuense]NHN27656.1 aminotransferase class I/II-fold pyridoxal phosphate-dependent enzyme [Flavobacterium jejuense]